MNPLNREALEALYRGWNRREYVEPDPLQFLYDYPETTDREVAGLIASSLAYGRVASILQSVKKALSPLGREPRNYLIASAPRDIRVLYRDFQHRFTDGEELAEFLVSIRHVIKNYGSLENCFMEASDRNDETVLPGLTGLVKSLASASKRTKWSLLSDPERGSAVKRHMLFLRWMVRHDVVDPGGWDKVNPSGLVIPLDTHMFQFGKRHGLTQRKSADIRAALEITEAFRSISPGDPVRYDFAITRFGIRGELCCSDLDLFLDGGYRAVKDPEKSIEINKKK